MKDVTETATTESAFGQPIPAHTYTFTYKAYEDGEALVDTDKLSEDEQKKVADARRLSNARTKQYNKEMLALGFVKPDINNNDQMRLREFYKVVMSSGKFTEEQARAKASETLGIEWAS